MTRTSSRAPIPSGSRYVVGNRYPSALGASAGTPTLTSKLESSAAARKESRGILSWARARSATSASRRPSRTVKRCSTPRPRSSAATTSDHDSSCRSRYTPLLSEPASPRSRAYSRNVPGWAITWLAASESTAASREAPGGIVTVTRGPSEDPHAAAAQTNRTRKSERETRNSRPTFDSLFRVPGCAFHRRGRGRCGARPSRRPAAGPRVRRPSPLRHRREELVVRLGALEPLEQELDRLDRRHVGQEVAEQVHLVELFLGEQDLFLAGAGPLHVDRGEGATLGDATVEDHFHVARALELLEDHLVHAGAGVDQRGGENRERAAALDVARGAEEALGLLQRVRVHTARQDLARVRHHHVVSAAQAGDRVEQDDDVLAVLHQALGLFDHHVGHLDVAIRRLVERRGDHLDARALDVLLHIRHLLGPLVDEQHDEIDLGMVFDDGVGELLEEDGLAGLGWRNDEAALAHADGTEDVHHPHRQVAVFALELDAPFGVARAQVVERDPVLRFLRLVAVHHLDLQQGEVALPFLGRPHLTHDRIPGAQVEPLDLARRDVDVVGPVQVVPVGTAQEAVAFGQDLEDALAPQHGVGVEQRLLDAEDQVLLAEPW